MFFGADRSRRGAWRTPDRHHVSVLSRCIAPEPSSGSCDLDLSGVTRAAMKRRSLFTACTLVVLSLTACGADPSDGAFGESDASIVCSPEVPSGYQDKVDTATRSPDGKGWCCQPGPSTCDCGYFGGFVEDRCECGRIRIPGPILRYCDLAPPDWIPVQDEHGCSTFRARIPQTACCNCAPSDAGAP